MLNVRTTVWPCSLSEGFQRLCLGPPGWRNIDATLGGWQTRGNIPKVAWPNDEFAQSMSQVYSRHQFATSSTSFQFPIGPGLKSAVREQLTSKWAPIHCTLVRMPHVGPRSLSRATHWRTTKFNHMAPVCWATLGNLFIPTH